jgi:hypothetical protein
LTSAITASRRNGGGGVAHVAHDQAREQRKSGQRNSDERDNGFQNLGARTLRRPAETRDRPPAAVHDLVDVFVDAVRGKVDHAQVVELKALSDVGENVRLDEPHGHHDRPSRTAFAGASVARNRPCGHHAQAAPDVLEKHRHGAAARQLPAVDQPQRSLGNGGRAPAREFDDRLKRRDGGGRQPGISPVAARLRMDDLVFGIEHDHEIVVAQGAEPGAHSLSGRATIDVFGADGGARLNDVDQAAQRPFAMIDDGAHEKLLFARERHLVGALRRGEGGDHDADDGDRDHDAERHQHAQACPVPPRGRRVASPAA